MIPYPSEHTSDSICNNKQWDMKKSYCFISLYDRTYTWINNSFITSPKYKVQYDFKVQCNKHKKCWQDLVTISNTAIPMHKIRIDNVYVHTCIKYISFNLLEIKRAPVLSWLMELTENGLEKIGMLSNLRHLIFGSG